MINSIDDCVRYLRRFHRSLSDGPSLSLEAVPSDLPYALSLVYLELGHLVEIQPCLENNWTAPFATQDALVPVSELRRIDGLVEFAWENQGNWSARCSVNAADPPVLTNAGDGSGAREFNVVCNSVADFLVTLSLQEATMGAPVLFHADCEAPAELIEAPLARLWSGPYAVRDFDHYEFYEIEEEGLIVMKWGGIWMGSYSQDMARLFKRSVQVHQMR